LFEVLACAILAIRRWIDFNPRIDKDIAYNLLTQAHKHFAGWCVQYVKKKPAITQKTPIAALSRKRAESGVRIAVWFRCSLNKQTANGN